MVNMQQLMKKAQEMQSQMQKKQEEIAKQSYSGKSGGGMVEVVMNGKHKIEKIKIDPSLLDENEVEMLEDLIMAAYNEAKNKLDTDSQDSMANMMGNLPPGFKMPL